MAVSGVDAHAARTSGPGEVVSLTSLRGVLALWVVAYHFGNDFLRLFPQARFLSPVLQMGLMAVPAFFMLSGFVLSYNYADRFRTLRRSAVITFLYLRLARIYPVHFITLMAVVAMVGVSDRLGYQLTDAGYSMRDFILNLLLMHTWVPHFELNWNYPSWSISSEWFAYLVFPFAIAGLRRGLTTRRRAVLFGVLTLAGSVAVMLRWQPWPFYELVLVLPTFYVGAAIYWVFRDRMRARPDARGRWLPEVLAVALVAFCFLPTTEWVVTSLLCGFVALIAVLVWLGAGCHRVWTSRPAVFLGEVSYSLYMTHTLAQKVLYRLLPAGRFEDASVILKLGVVAAYIAVVIAFCLATYYLVENPCRRLFKKALPRPSAEV